MAGLNPLTLYPLDIHVYILALLLGQGSLTGTGAVEPSG